MRRRIQCHAPLLVLALLLSAVCGGGTGGTDAAPSVFGEIRTESASLDGASGGIELTVARIPAASLPDSTVAMWLGRFIEASDYGTDTRRVMVVSHDVWQQLGANPAIIGTEHDVDGESHVLIGIAPPGWAEPANANAWIPEG